MPCVLRATAKNSNVKENIESQKKGLTGVTGIGKSEIPGPVRGVGRSRHLLVDIGQPRLLADCHLSPE